MVPLVPNYDGKSNLKENIRYKGIEELLLSENAINRKNIAHKKSTMNLLEVG